MDSRSFVLLRRRAVERRAARNPEVVTTTPEKLLIFAAALRRWPGHAGDDQRSRLLSVMRRTPISTFQARTYLDCAAPSQRIGELRETCPHIVVTKVFDVMNPGGSLHVCALYTLVHDDGE